MAVSRVGKGKFYAQLTEEVGFIKVVSEVNRLKILSMLRGGEKCVCDIWQRIKLPQNLTSHHLKILKDAGLVTSRKEGLKVLYRLNDKALERGIELLRAFLLP